MKKIIKLPIYNCKVNFILSSNINTDIAKIAKKRNQDFSIDFEVEGIVFYFDLSEYYILINDLYLTHNTLAHEIFHLTNKITVDREIKDEESQAWLCAILTEDIYNFLESKKRLIS